MCVKMCVCVCVYLFIYLSIYLRTWTKPTYDIVPKKGHTEKKFEPGDVVDVAFEDKSLPATIIDIDGIMYCKQ